MGKTRKRPPKGAPSRLTTKQVVSLVKKYLEPHQPKDYRLKVIEAGVKKEDDWWYVLVEPDRMDARSYEYYGRLAEAEIDLKDAESVNVLLVPVLPG